LDTQLLASVDELVRALPAGSAITDPVLMDKYRRDRADDPGAGMPAVVVRATSVADVQLAMRFAASHGLGVVPRGAGTGLSGGASAATGCVVISTERMTRIGIDPITRIADVEPGALNVAVKNAAAEHGLWYPPDPSSYEICSIGGNVATNAGGLCCVKYGVTTDYVLGLDVVLADGTLAELGGPRLKDSAGLSLVKLFVGSEGTLGIITRIALRLLPKQRLPSTVVASFARTEDATRAVVAITRKIRPSMLEFMDRVSINAVEDLLAMGLDRSVAAMLVIQSDEHIGAATEELQLITSACSSNNAVDVFTTDDPVESEAFVLARRSAIPAVERMGRLLLEDVGVPIPLLGELVEGIATISHNREVPIAVIAHAGDGNTHPLIIVDPLDPRQLERANLAFGEVMDLAIALGGTITGEHGVGRLKKAWLPAQLSPTAFALNQRIKHALDPAGILNPGAVF
jgi:glycolate oxidase